MVFLSELPIGEADTARLFDHLISPPAASAAQQRCRYLIASSARVNQCRIGPAAAALLPPVPAVVGSIIVGPVVVGSVIGSIVVRSVMIIVRSVIGSIIIMPVIGPIIIGGRD